MMKDEIRNITVITLKDLKAYYFKPATISWGILFPTVFLLIFSLKNSSDISTLIGGLRSMSIFFGSTSMTTTSIMLERRTNVFDIYYTLPVSYYGIVAGKVSSGFLFGIFSSLIMLVISIFIADFKIYSALYFILWILVSSFAFSSFGVFMSLLVKEAYDAMIYMNLIRLPLIFISGVFLPIKELPAILRSLAYISPLTYSVDMAGEVFLNKSFIGMNLSLLILTLFGVIFFMLSRYRVEHLRE